MYVQYVVITQNEGIQAKVFTVCDREDVQTEDAHISVFLQAVVVSLVWLALHRHVVSCLVYFSYPPEFKHMFDGHKLSSEAQTLKKQAFGTSWKRLTGASALQCQVQIALQQPELSEAAASNKATTYTVKNGFFAKVDNTD